ncbi:MAG: CobW family GTP-binding protein [Geminicoccaceae bacterium]
MTWHQKRPGDPVPVTIITGFLGSGKTTLLAKLLRHPVMGQTAVIINEFGEIGLDHELIETSDETDVTLMGGCLCCTVKGDLIDTMQRLHVRRELGEAPRFERLIIETTGLADPAPVLQSIMADPELQRRYRLDGVVTVIDAVNGLDTLDRHLEALKQAAVADRLVVTKTDVASPDEVNALRAKLVDLNPAARIVEADHGDVAPDLLLDAGIFDPRSKSPDVERWLNEEAYAYHHHDHDAHGHHHDVNRHDNHIKAFCIRHDQPIPSTVAGFFLDVLMAERGSDLLRVKGLVNIAEQPETPMVIHGVQHVIHAPAYLDSWPSEDRDSRLVFIVKGITKEQIERLLNVLLDNRPYHEIAKAVPRKSSESFGAD